VTLLEFGAELRADAVLVNKLKSLPNVTIIATRRPPSSPARRQAHGLNYKDRVTGEASASSWKAASCRSAWCPTPSGCAARWSCPSTARSS
jgi:alkyl hydroperoxide reductase subunit AhpF